MLALITTCDASLTVLIIQCLLLLQHMMQAPLLQLPSVATLALISLVEHVMQSTLPNLLQVPPMMQELGLQL